MLELNKMKIQWQQIDVIPFLQYLTSSFDAVANSKNIHLVFHSELKELWLDVDKDKLKKNRK